MDAAALVSKVKTEGSFAVDDLTALGWLNEVYGEAVARSGWIERVVSLGTTVIGTSQYVISDTYVDVRSVKIANNRYTVRATVQEMWDLQSGYTTFAGKAQDGVFAEGFDATDVRYVEVFPTPVANGQAIKAFVSALPTDLVLGPPPTSPLIPVDMHAMLVAGAVALGLSRWSERDDLAEPKRAVFEAGVKELQTRANARVGGAPGDRERIYAADFVSRVKAEGKFDAVDSSVLAWINEAYADLAVRSGWNVQPVAASTVTAIGTSNYALSEPVASVQSVLVGSTRYTTKISEQEYEDLVSGYASSVRVASDSGLFVERLDASGVPQIRLFPGPSSNGQTITVQAVVQPTALTLTATTMPEIPADLYGAVIAGAIAIGQGRYSGQPDLAQAGAARFEQMVAELAKRAMARDRPHERRIAFGNTFVERLKEEGNFGVSDSTLLAWINEAYTDLVARSEWNVNTVAAGNTAGGTALYTVPGTISSVRSVNVGTQRFATKVTQQELEDLRSGYATLTTDTGDAGVFVEKFDASGAATIELYPTPGSTQAITVQAVVLPAALTLTATAMPALPPDAWGNVIHGALAIGQQRYAAKPDLAQANQALFDAAVQQLGARAKRRDTPHDRPSIRGGDFVARVKLEGNFDVPDKTILTWLNEAYTDLVARSEWNLLTVAVGTTVNGTPAYTVPGAVSSVRSVNVNNQRYGTKVTQQELEDLRSGYATMTFDAGDPGVFVERFDVAGAAVIDLFPTPTVNGQAITAQAVVLPAALAITATTMPAIPADMYGNVIAGAIGIGRQRFSGQPDLAQANVATFEQAVEQLAARAKRRDMPHERKLAYGNTDLVGRVKAEGNFDAADSTVLGWVNEAYRDLVARSGWIERVVNIGPTDNALSQYVLPDVYVSVKSIRVGSGSGVYRYTRAVTVREIWDLQSGYAAFSGKTGDGVFAEGFGSGDVRYVELHPKPPGGGQALDAFVTALPTDLTLTAQTPVIPVDLQSALIAGAVAIGLSRWKQAPEASLEPQKRFEAGVEELRKRANNRVGGASETRGVIYGTDLTARVKAEGNFDVEDSTVLGWVNEAYRDAVARSGWLREQINLGPSVAGLGRYALDEGVVEVQSVLVNGNRYDLVLTATEIYDLTNGDMTLIRRMSSGGGAYAAGYDTAGARFVDVWPVPTASGQPITALVTKIPVDLTLNPVTNPALPADLSTSMLAAGAIAIGLARWKQRPDLAKPQQEAFDKKVEELRRRANARVGGSRAHRMPIAGYDFA